MSDKVTPGVILSSRFVFSQKKFSEYINYIDRSEAVRSEGYNLYSVYADYMDDPKKQPAFNPESERASALFTTTKDRLTAEEKENLKHQFLKAQKNESPMWQNVISFTNEFLEKNGLYDSSSGLLDENKIRHVTRLSINEMLTNEKMDASAVWSASIHYNTDNIHVHIAVVEPNPTRRKKEFTTEKKDGTKEQKVQFKGMLKPKTFAKMKSKIVNNIVDRSPQLTKINEIIRNDIVKERHGRNSYKDKNLRGVFLNLYSKLPPDKRMWNYNMSALKDIRPQIDEFTKMYIDMYHKKDFTELVKQLDEQQEFLKSVYGVGKKKMYENYKQTKINDLYTRMGNSVLSELRNYDKTLRSERTLSKRNISAVQKLRNKNKFVQKRSSSIYNLKKSMYKDYFLSKNEIEHENLERNIEWAIEKGGYSKENALEFSKMKAQQMGLKSYGAPDYVSHVLKYYSCLSASGNSFFTCPISFGQYRITSGFGYRNGKLHKGIDLAAPIGTKIYASASGTVVFSGFGKIGSGFGGYGNVVMIKHNKTYCTLYGHCSKLLVSPGANVQKGELIALVGNTGNSEGNHCHFEIRVNGESVNPLPYLSKQKKS